MTQYQFAPLYSHSPQPFDSQYVSNYKVGTFANLTAGHDPVATSLPGSQDTVNVTNDIIGAGQTWYEVTGGSNGFLDSGSLTVTIAASIAVGEAGQPFKLAIGDTGFQYFTPVAGSATLTTQTADNCEVGTGGTLNAYDADTCVVQGGALNTTNITNTANVYPSYGIIVSTSFGVGGLGTGLGGTVTATNIINQGNSSGKLIYMDGSVNGGAITAQNVYSLGTTGMTNIIDGYNQLLDVTNYDTYSGTPAGLQDNLLIQGGGEVKIENSIGAGRQQGDFSTIIVADFTSRLVCETALILGDAGSGVLDVFNEGEVESTSGVIGNQTGGSGTAFLAAGAAWQIAGNLTVGAAGYGILRLETGSLVSVTGNFETGSVAGGAFEGGSTTAFGADTALAVKGSSTIGDYGTAAVTIGDDASYATASVSVADNGGSIGYLKVISGATLTTSDISVGNNLGHGGHGGLSLSDAAALSLADGLTIEQNGLVSISATSTSIQGAVSNSGLLYLAKLTAAFSDGVSNTGDVLLNGAALSISGALTGAGTIYLENSSTLTMNSPAMATGGTIMFEPASGTAGLILNGTTFAGTISGLAGNDYIKLSGITATSASFSNGTLQILNGASNVTSLTLSGNYAGVTFNVTETNSNAIITLGAATLPPVVVTPPLDLSGMSSITGVGGKAVAVSGFSVSDSASGATITADVLSDTGMLAASTSASGGGGTIYTAQDGTELIVTGTLTQVNADLTTLTYLAEDPGPDTIRVIVSDSAGNANEQDVSVTVPGVAPALTVPGAQTITSGLTTALSGIGIADSLSLNLNFTVTVSASLGTLYAPQNGGSLVTSTDTGGLTMTGDLADINADLAQLVYYGSGVASGATGSTSINLTVDDGMGDTSSQAIAVNLTGSSSGSAARLPGLTYSNSDETFFYETATGGVLEIIDPTKSNALITSLVLTGNFSQELLSLENFGAGAYYIDFNYENYLSSAPGDVIVSNVSGQPYSGYEQLFSQGLFTGTNYFFTANQGYGGSYYTYNYSAGNDFIGSEFFYSGISTPYNAYEYDYDGGGNVVRIDFTGVSGAGYSSYEYDYTGGVYSGSKFQVTAVAAAASYSSYQLDYNANNTFTGDNFYFNNIVNQSYTMEEEDFNATGNLLKVLLSGFSNEPYSSLELDYNAGTYAGYKAIYAPAGQPAGAEEIDVNANNQITEVIYSDLTNTPYSSAGDTYSNGTFTGTVYDFTDVQGATYFAYQVTEDANNTPLQETLDNNDSSHTIVGFQSNQTFASVANDTFTGGGSGETFVLSPAFGHDTITDFASYLSGTGHDTISFAASDFASFSSMMTGAQNSGSNVLITAPSGNTLTLENVTTSALSANASDFSFHS